MQESEFDHFAEEYLQLHASTLAISGERPEFFSHYKIELLARFVKKKNIAAQHILDFGCGVGNCIPHFKNFFPAATLYGMDKSKKSLVIAAERFKESAIFMPINEDQIVCDQSFDVLFTACVFHHIPHEQHVHWLQELRRHAKPNALLAVFEHNPWNPLTVRVVNQCPFDYNARLISAPTMKKIIAKAGWRNVQCRYGIFFPSFLAYFRPLEKWLGWLPLGGQYVSFARA